MTIDQLRAVLEKRADKYLQESSRLQGGHNAYKAGKHTAYREVLDLLKLIDGERGPCPACGGRMGSRLPDGRWRCDGLSSYAVTKAELCGHVYHGDQGTPR